MRKPDSQKTLLFLLVLLALAAPTNVLAQHQMSGEVGADIGSYGFRNHIFDSGLKYDSDRRLANEYLDLSLNGPLVNSYFAGYSAMMRLRATQIRSEVDGEVTTEHLNPKLTNYSGAVSLFPNRPFPVRIFTGHSEENAVRYESGNRSEVDLVDPGLAVVRRYATVNDETGAQVRWAVMPDLELGLEVKTTANQLERQYDFDENRNIWVDFLTISPGVAPYYNIEVVNTIPDRDVLVYVDFALADTVRAGGTLDLVIEEGRRDLDFIPVGLNSYSRQLNISSDMQWKIFFNDPPGSKDMDQTNDIVMARLLYGKEGPFKTDAYVEFNDGNEEVQDMVTSLQTFNNLATYDFSSNASLSSLTTYSSNLTDVGVISHQQSDMFMQQTTGKWRRSRGLSTMVSHSYSKMSSDTGVDLTQSTNNIFLGQANLPTNWNGHEVNLRLNGNFLADNKDFSNNTLSAELGNTLQFRGAGFRWRPKHVFKKTHGETVNPDGVSDELDSKLSLEGEHPGLWQLGNVRLKGQYDWRRKENEKGLDTKNRYLAEVGLIRKFGSRVKFKVMAGLDNESFDFQATESSANVPQREGERRKTLRLDLQTNPAKGYDISGNAVWTKSQTSRIRKFAVSLRLKVPVINLPLRSFLVKEYRELEGQRPQEFLQIETKTSYSFRKIRLVLSHRLTDETLTTENYVYSEFLAKVSRNFDVY